jgi:hypothetical protein
MKTRLIFYLLILTLFLPGCLVKSLHPFYTDQDVIFKKELTGTWTDSDSTIWVIQQHMQSTGMLTPSKPGKSYDITVTDQQGTATFLAHLFQLQGQLYLDFSPGEVSCGNTLAGFHMVGTHSLAKVELAGGKIAIRWYNEEWLADLFNKNRIRISHERVPYDPDINDPNSMQIILTASTSELQKFVIKYGNDPNAFETANSGKKGDYSAVLTKTTLK